MAPAPALRRRPYAGPVPVRSLVACAALAASTAAALGGCGRGEFEDRTAVVRVGGSSRTYEVASCGLDDRTLFLVARAADGAVVQAVVGLEDDLEAGVPASTGVSIDEDPTRTDTRSAAFGAEAWERRGEQGAPPGSISAARLRGSRIQVDGELVPVDAQDRAVAGADGVAFSLDARCDQADG